MQTVSARKIAGPATIELMFVLNRCGAEQIKLFFSPSFRSAYSTLSVSGGGWFSSA
jgi:hypothetical protein